MERQGEGGREGREVRRLKRNEVISEELCLFSHLLVVTDGG